jgi:hypothetical protein
MGLSTIPIRLGWLLRHEWFAIILFIMEMMTRSPSKRINHRPKRESISSHITTILATLSNFQPPYPRQRKKNQKLKQVHATLCNFPEHHSPTNQPVCCLLPPHVTGSTSCEFNTHCTSDTNASLISFTNEWVFGATFRVVRAFKELVRVRLFYCPAFNFKVKSI